MNPARFHIFLCSLLLVSLALNVWQFLRPVPEPALGTAVRAARAGEQRDSSGQPAARLSGADHKEEKPDGDRGAEAQKTDEAAKDLAALPEEELLFGSWKNPGDRTYGEPTSRITGEQMQALAKQEPSKAAKFRIHAVLHLPGNRTLDLGASETGPGQPVKIQRIKEFPYPTSIAIANPAPPSPGSSFPVTPTTPGDFDLRNQGLEIEVDVTPAPGTLVLGGQVTHRTFEGFGRMPGEVFSPIYTKGTSESGANVDVILTDNKVLQPQFVVAETPFLAAATEGEPCRIPVRMTWGQATLELTCTPLE